MRGGFCSGYLFYHLPWLVCDRRLWQRSLPLPLTPVLVWSPHHRPHLSRSDVHLQGLELRFQP